MTTLTIRPSGVGTETAIGTQFPDEGEHWEKVDEVVADEDATYVAAIVDGRDLYALEDPSASGTINSVTVYVRVTFVSSSGTVNAKSSIRIGGTTYDGDAHAHPVGYTTESHTWNQNPNSEAAWTWADINNLEAGVWLQGLGTRWTRCTQVYAVIDYDLTSFVDLLGRGEVGQDSAELLGKGIIRQAGSAELLGKLDAQVSLNLPADLIVRHQSTVDLLGKCVVTRSIELPGNVVIRNIDSVELLAEAAIRHIGTPVELSVKIVIRQVGIPFDFPGKTTIRHTVPVELLSRGIIRHEGIPVELLGRVEIGQGSVDLPARFEVGQGAEELLGRTTIRHPATSDLKLILYVRPRHLTAAEMLIGGRDRRMDLGGLDRKMVVGGRDRRMRIR